MKPVQVEHIESAQDDPVQQERPPVLRVAEGLQEGEDPVRRVGPVDPDRPDRNRLDVLGRDQGDSGEGRLDIGARKPAVVDPDHAQVTLRERAL